MATSGDAASEMDASCARRSDGRTALAVAGRAHAGRSDYAKPPAYRSPGGVLRLQRSRYPSAAHHLDRRFATSFRRNLVSLSAATQTARRHVGVRALAGSRRTLHVRFDIGGVTIVAVPIGTIVAVPRPTDPYAARADSVP